MPLRGRVENRVSLSVTAKGQTRLKGKELACEGGVPNLCRAVPAEITLSMASQEETGITQRLWLRREDPWGSNARGQVQA